MANDMPITSFRSVIDLWDTREALAAETGAGSRTVSKWWQRDSIPADWWSTILATTIAKAAGLSADALARLAARAPSEVA